jgi:hypothetical protein
MSDDGGLGRPQYVVGVVIVLALLTLYVALGGPLPFVAEGGPALDSVPSEADAVVYTDAWTFSSDTSRNVADGLLTATDESVPGYAGPASLDAAFESLQETELSSSGLRSVTAFTAYSQRGQPTGYSGVILKTTWETDDLQRAFGDGPDSYAERRRQGQTVFVDEDADAQFPWIAKLGADRFVLGNESAVVDAIDATEGRDGIDPTLEAGFRSLTRGPIRFASTLPDRLPGQALAPDRVTDTVDAVETIGGVYYPKGDSAAVELELIAADGETAERIRPSLSEAIGFARRQVPDSTAALLGDATVSREDTTVSVEMVGPTRSFVDGYRAILESAPVRLLLGQSVGTPALDLVPANASLVAYADAGVVADPTTFRVAEAVADRGSDTPRADLAGTARQILRESTLDPTAFRSVTLFSTAAVEGADSALEATNRSDTALVVEADWSRDAVARTLDNGSITYDARTVGGRPVFVLDNATWLAVLEGHQVLGAPAAVERVVEVDSGGAPALDGRMREAFERLPSTDVSGVVRLPDSVEEPEGGLLGPADPGVLFSSAQLLGVSYQSGLNVVDLRVDLHLDSTADAVQARGVLELGRQVVLNGIDDERVRALVRSTDLGQSGRVVSGTASTDSGSVVAAVEWLLDQFGGVPLSPLGSTSGPGTDSALPARTGGVTP